MDIGTMSLLLLVAIFVLLAIGVPLGFATGLLGAIVIFFKFGEPGLGLVMQRVYDLAVTYAIIAVPLFIFMASLLERSGIARDMYDALNLALGRMRGGVAVVTTVMAVIMAAMSGIIGGEIVLLGLVALPQMLRLGYNQNLAIGTICAGGSLGTMIPPSVVLIMFGLITETSINALFTAAFLPGLLMGTLYILYIIVRTRLNPSLAPLQAEIRARAGPAAAGALAAGGPVVGDPASRALAAGDPAAHVPATGDPAARVPAAGDSAARAPAAGDSAARTPAAGDPSRVMMETALTAGPFVIGAMAALIAGARGVEGSDRIAWLIFVSALVALGVVLKLRNDTRFPVAKGLLPPLIVVDLVLGSIYGGVTGITEAAAMGVVASFVLITIRRELGGRMFGEALAQTFRSVGTILWVTFGATVLAGAYSLSGGNAYAANLIVGLDVAPIGIIVTMMLVFLVLGMFMDWIGIVLLTMPVFMPIVKQLGYDPIWFGILFCINMQVAFLTPPFGSAAFYLKSVAPPHIDLVAIYRSFGPFMCLQLFVLALVLFFPQIALVFVR